jgi:hypothetical protein
MKENGVILYSFLDGLYTIKLNSGSFKNLEFEKI